MLYVCYFSNICLIVIATAYRHRWTLNESGPKKSLGQVSKIIFLDKRSRIFFLNNGRPVSITYPSAWISHIPNMCPLLNYDNCHFHIKHLHLKQSRIQSQAHIYKNSSFRLTFKRCLGTSVFCQSGSTIYKRPLICHCQAAQSQPHFNCSVLRCTYVDCTEHTMPCPSRCCCWYGASRDLIRRCCVLWDIDNAEFSIDAK